MTWDSVVWHIGEAFDGHPLPWHWDMVHDGSDDPYASYPMILDADYREVWYLKGTDFGSIGQLAFAAFLVGVVNATPKGSVPIIGGHTRANGDGTFRHTTPPGYLT